MRNKINPYRRNAEVLRNFFRQPITLVISIALTISFLTQILLSVYSFFTINEYGFSFIPFIYLLPITAFMSLFIKTHKNARNFSGSPGLPLLTIYNVISIILILCFAIQLVSLYISYNNEYLKIFNLQSYGYPLMTFIYVLAILIVPLIFAVSSLIFIYSINKSFKSIYLYRKGSVLYSIFALICAVLYIVFITMHFFHSTTEYRGSIYFFLTTAICIIEFITYILYTVFGFSYNSFIKTISFGITESNNESSIFEAKPKNENYKPLNMWDESDKKKAKNFTPQNVFDQNNNQNSIPREFDMWNESESTQSIPPQEPIHRPETVNNNFNVHNNFTKTEPTVINPNPVFKNANSTEPKHNRFEDWNDKIKSNLEHFDDDYSRTQNNSRPVVNTYNNIPSEKFTIPPVFTSEEELLENLHIQPETAYHPINVDSMYDNSVNTNISPDVQVGAEFIPTNNSTKRTQSIPQNEDFHSVHLWEEPIMPKSRKVEDTPQVIIDHTSHAVNPVPSQPKKGDIDGNIYINTLWEAPIMNYGSNRVPRYYNAENPYVENQMFKADKKAKKNKKKSAYYQQPTPQAIICPTCRSVCSSDVYFCVKCGTILK